MEDKKRKKDDKRKRETSQKVVEQKNKVSDGTKPPSSQPPATQSGSASPSPGSTPSASPSPAAPSPGSAATPAQGANNAKRLVVANGQPPSSAASQQRYMPREVPPRFRCQQDHKVLLKRGQPPLPQCKHGCYSSAAAVSLSLASSLAASTTTSNYANSMWGTGSGSQTSAQGRVIVDGNNLEEWPSIASGDGGGASSAGLSGQPGGGAPGSAGGPLLQQPSSLSKAPAATGSHDAVGPLDGSGGIPGANFNPNANPSAWPALVQQDGTPAVGEGGQSSLRHQGPGGSLSADGPASPGPGAGSAVGVPGGHPPLSVNQSNAHQHQLHQMQSRDRETGGGKWEGGSVGPKMAVVERAGGGDCEAGGSGAGLGGGDPGLASSWRGQPSYPAAVSKTGASRTDEWESGGGSGAAGGDNGTSGWGYQGSASAWGTPASGGSGGVQASAVSQGGSGSGPHGGHSRTHRPAPNAEAALQNLLSRSDLDPRVLSNTGWGQTQIRQNTSWDLDAEAKRGGGYSAGPGATATDSTGPGVNPSAGSSGEGWESSNSSSSGASVSGRGPPPPGPNMRNSSVSQSSSMSAGAPMGAGGMGSMHSQQGKATAPNMGQSGWGSSSPTSPPVDNGTAAWGKTAETPSTWGDPGEAGAKTSGWGNPSVNPIKPGVKSMQDGWGEGESSVAASGTQGSGSSWGQGSNGGWSQGHGPKKPSNKGPMKGPGDSWMNPINRQFSNMGLLGDDPSVRHMDLAPGQDKKMEAEKRAMGMSDYNGDLRKGVRGGAMPYRSPGPKEAGPVDPGSYYDKDGYLGEEAHGSLYSPPTVFKSHPLYNHTVPLRQGSHNMFGLSGGGGVAQSRHPPSVPPINPSPGIRAQVPHQFLSPPQVPGSMLKQMPPPSGGVGGPSGVGGGVFPPQLSPQQIAMLSSIYPPHIQFQLAHQKFPQNVRQQADPQQLARIMAVLRQQQQAGGVGGLGGSSKLSPSHLGGGVGLGGPKLPGVESLGHGGLGGSVADMHQKAHGGYSGFGSGVNLSGLDIGGSMMGGHGGMKDMGGQQSRFKWMMEGHSPPDPSAPESMLHKNGPVGPMKMAGVSPYSQYDMGVDGLGDNWHRTPGNKMASKPASATSWPPEFQPGVPWKGIDRVDPESDPYMTPGSMMGNASSPNLNDSDHQLLQDNADSTPPLNTLLPSPGAWPYSASDSPLNNAHNPVKYTDYKGSWPPEPIGHNKPWKAGSRSSQSNQNQLSRPPPGLASQKQSMPSPWSGGAPRLAARGWSSSTGASTWSDGSARGSCWLVLSNLTPQIDGSTLRTICMQHGPLLTFHLGLTHGTALIRYSSKQEAAKAQNALHMCVLGNTTILAEFVSEEEVARYIAHSQAGGGSGGAVGSPGSGPVGSSSMGGGNGERGLEGGSAPGGVGSGGGNGGPGAPGSAWQSLDGTGGSQDPPAPQGPGLGMFAPWSTNGAGVGGGGGMESGRQGLWGGMGGGMGGAGYSSSSLWGSPALDDRHQMGSPAALLPGDLLGGGAD
ncbi:hypothetical protein NHX12_025401 [Muraenolepis orangiensis]|uniref:TNRC6 PABC binding domain-containing protein n=1 Tax=Muraenolepis orangiensis TaxID=630683 RepID=A0A9Q0IS90_9TELE|nr:hypothetical protein NHX12_025401 [Muraenolepis orangiensis]